MFAGAIIFSLNVGSLTSLLSEMDEQNNIYESKLMVLSKIKETYKISDETMLKIRTVIKYGVYRNENEFDELIDILPQDQATELALIIYKPRTKGIIFFMDKKDELIKAVGPYLNPITFAAGDYIYMKGEYTDEMFFVQSGVVALVLPEHKDLVCMTVQKGGYFGEIEIIKNSPRIFTYKAMTEVHVVSLEKRYVSQIFFKDFKHIGMDLKDTAESRYTKQTEMYMQVEEIANTFKSEQLKQAAIRQCMEDFEYNSSSKKTIEDLDLRADSIAPQLSKRRSERLMSSNSIVKNIIEQMVSSPFIPGRFT